MSRVTKEEMVRARLDENGHEVVSSVPMAPPLGYRKEPTVSERIREMIRSERLRQEAEQAGAETFEEADDFDVGDDVDPSSPFEENFDPGAGPPVRLSEAEWKMREERRYTEAEWKKLKATRTPPEGGAAPRAPVAQAGKQPVDDEGAGK